LGESIVKALLTEAKPTDPEVAAFCRDWLFVSGTASFLPPWANSKYVEIAHDLMPDDPDITMLFGAFAAAGMGPRAIGDGPYGVGWGEADKRVPLISAGGEEYNGDEERLAEAAFKKRLQQDPSYAEASLRLGRVLQLTNRPTQAEAEFQRSLRASAASHDQ